MERGPQSGEKSSFNKALVEELKSAAQEHVGNGTPEQQQKLEHPSLDQLRVQASEQGGVVLYHGGLPETATVDDIDLDRVGAQQNKRNRTYGGFYLSDESSMDWAAGYAEERNGILHGFLIVPAARVGEITGRDIDRLSTEERAMLREGYDLVKGKDLLGRSQYVLLNKEVIDNMGYDKIPLKKTP